MKKIIIFLFVFILAVSFLGCNNSTDNEHLYNLIDQHKQIEYGGAFELSYEKLYTLADATYVHPKYFVDDSKEIFVKGDLRVTVGDLQALTTEEIEAYKKAGADYLKQFKNSFTDYKETTKLSKVYEDEEHGWKYIFEQKILSFKKNDDSGRSYINTRYRFNKVDGVWKILAVDGTQRNYGKYDQQLGVDEEKMVKEMGFNRFNNELVEYVKTLKD